MVSKYGRCDFFPVAVLVEIKLLPIRDMKSVYLSSVLNLIFSKPENHSISFVEPIPGVHAQNIESYWNVKKTLIKKCEVANENYCTAGTFKNICGEIVLIEITMLLIILLGISIYSTNFELFSAVSVWGGEIVHLVSWEDSSLDPKLFPKLSSEHEKLLP